MHMYILAWEKDPENGIQCGIQYFSLEVALEAAEKGQYIHTVYVESYPVTIGQNSLGEKL